MSWWQLVSIYKEFGSIAKQEAQARPTACPNDGQPLQSKGSILHCPFDGYTWPESESTRKGKRR